MIRNRLPAFIVSTLAVVAALDIFELAPKGATSAAVLAIPLLVARNGLPCLRWGEV